MKRKEYSAPNLTVVQFLAEQGYTLSLPTEDAVNPLNDYIEMMMLDNNDTYRETETFIEHSDWTNDNSGAFWL